jgi:hypothetical protein
MRIITKTRTDSIALSDGSEDLIMAASFIADCQDESELLTHFHRLVTKGGRIDFVEPVAQADDGKILEQTITILIPPPPSEEPEPTTEGLILP